ncbi:high mobility group protein HMG-I/HMG-Y [Lagopus leucura]|uniref:high mobility group protein HMG-I/HMG-Y n=1 Tax=Lagopus leucura TaxID=30410 RepID=UPI001C67F9EE|nr:high mobility group protein HMG-I/HMG-Y [Lagopus leucura]
MEGSVWEKDPPVLQPQGRMSDAGAKPSPPLASKGEKDAAEKRGRGRPRKKPEDPSEAPTPTRPPPRPPGINNQPIAQGRGGGWKSSVAPGMKPRGRPKKPQQDEEEVNISQESSEEEQ